MIKDINELLIQYRAWLEEKTVLKEVAGWIEITTPYLDRHNDYLQLYANRRDGSWILSDDGYTIGDLEASGINVSSSPKRTELITMTLNGFGVDRSDSDELTVIATDANFSLKKHNLIQAMLAVGDMFYLARPMVSSVFFEDVRQWLDESNIRYNERLKLPGRSGYDHYIDFIVPHSNVRPERLIQLINNPTKEKAESVCFSWIEVKDFRPQSMAYAFVNDTLRDVPQDVTEALARYEIKPVLFSKRNEAREELAT